jgi:hypothetical protein
VVTDRNRAFAATLSKERIAGLMFAEKLSACDATLLVLRWAVLAVLPRCHFVA